MKQLSRLLLLVGLIASLSMLAPAREVGTPPTNPDTWCVAGGNGYSGGFVTSSEVCVDYSGNMLPTLTNSQTLGTSALPWSTIYSVSATNTGNETNGTTGVTAASGTGGTAATQSVVNGISVNTPYSAFNLTISSIIPVNSGYEYVASSQVAVSLAGKPEISTTTVVGGSTLLPDGFILTLTSTGNAVGVTLTSSGTTAGSGLVLGASTRVILNQSTLQLRLNSTANPAFWKEILWTP